MAFLTHQRGSMPVAAGDLPAALRFLLMLAGVLILPATSGQDRHYQLKAAFLVNFAQYVEWPTEAFPTEETPFVFGVLGDNPFRPALKDLVTGEVVNGRKAVVEEYKSVREIRRCHILFISDSERTRLPAIMRALKGRSILTVSDLEGFEREGGMIRFVTQTRVRFRINSAAASEANLTISSKLLRLADSVESAKAK
jgi:hypothetical protein